MKNGIKPTRAQRKLMEKRKLDPFCYLVIKMMGPNGFLLQNRESLECVVIYENRNGVFKADGETPVEQ